MIQSKKYRVVLFSTVLFSIFFGVETSSAGGLNPDSLESDIDVTVIEGSEAPVPPAFGDDPEDPANNGTNNSGLLKIDRVPNFTFGKVVRSGLYQQEYAKNSNPYIQVSDLRGSYSGWTLYAQVSNFVSEPTADDKRRFVLSGATLSIVQGDIQEYQSEYAAPPKSYSVSLNEENQKIMTADKNAGQGVWAAKWESRKELNKKVKLDILPNTAKSGRDYTATITWRLADIPSIEG